MQTSLAPLISENRCQIYIDDTSVPRETFVKHGNERDERMILAKLCKASFIISGKKCRFAVSACKVLGFIITEAGISANPERTLAI